jgi:hypothetical protein
MREARNTTPGDLNMSLNSKISTINRPKMGEAKESIDGLGWTNRFMPLGTALKKSLVNLNRMQKRALMGLHYYLNLSILGIVLWHWLASRCKSSALPELGLMAVLILIALGFLMKFKLCPKAFRNNVYQIHTQPIIFFATFLVLTVGHLIVD